MILCAAAAACSSGPANKLPPPSTQRLDLSAAIAADCERLALAVAHPAMRAGDDADRVILSYVVALEVANATIGAGGACVKGLRDRYAAYAAEAKK